ncbi:unnamed protein product [Effrenium voratum]|nr:unnamed protein product [Effrenium voratum]
MLRSCRSFLPLLALAYGLASVCCIILYLRRQDSISLRARDCQQPDCNPKKAWESSSFFWSNPCPHGYQLETHDEKTHGDICRSVQDASFACPHACQRMARAPWCAAGAKRKCKADLALSEFRKGMLPNSQTRGLMHTFYEPVWNGGDKTGTLVSWEKAWTDAGWETRVLTLEDAKRSPEFKNVNRRIDRIPRGGNAEYERLCYLRYLAMNAVGGGWMSDMDTVPTRLSPDIGLPNAGRFTVYANFIPALVSGNATEYLRIVLSLTDLGLEQMGHKRLYTDMFALKDLQSRMPDAYFPFQMVAAVEDLVLPPQQFLSICFPCVAGCFLGPDIGRSLSAKTGSLVT